MMNELFHRLKRPLVAAFVGASTTLAFAPYQLWPVAILSPAILLILLANQTPKRALWIGYAWGLGQFATGVSWVYVSISGFGGMPLIANLFLMACLSPTWLFIPAYLLGSTTNSFLNLRSQKHFSLRPLYG